jgi:hypothetical protein
VRSAKFHLDEVVWHNDLAVFKSWKGQIPWESSLGKGKLKVLRFDAHTGAGTYLIRWPEGYNPFGEHGYGGNAELLVLEGHFISGGETIGPGNYIYTPKGFKGESLIPGPEGCTFFVSVDGPLFGEDFERELLTSGKARRFRA